MNTMNMPRFTAEKSLAPSVFTYRSSQFSSRNVLTRVEAQYFDDPGHNCVRCRAFCYRKPSGSTREACLAMCSDSVCP